MTTGLDYTEVYTDPNSPVGPPPGPAACSAPAGLRRTRLVLRLSAHAAQGAAAWRAVRLQDRQYRHARRGASARDGPTAEHLVSDRIFSQLGAEQDAYFTVDPTGVEFAGGGLNLTLRDLARFGETMRLDGRFNGQEIVPKAVIDDIRRGGDRASFSRAGSATLPGGSYRNMWWVLHNEHGAYSARGIHGQGLYVDPKAEMVIARFASHPLAANANYDATSLPAYQAVAELLLATPR